MRFRGIMQSPFVISPRPHAMPQLVGTATPWSLCLSLLAAFAGMAQAQGPTTAAIAGRIVDDRGLGVRGVEVVVMIAVKRGVMVGLPIVP